MSRSDILLHFLLGERNKEVMCSPSFKHVVQQKWNSCLASVAAMIVGETEDYVINWFEHKSPPFTDEDLMLFLAHHGVYLATLADLSKGDDKGIELSPNEAIQLNFSLSEFCAYMVVESERLKDKTHAVLWNTKEVLDPCHAEPQPLSRYKVVHFYPFLRTAIRKKEMERRLSN